MPQPSEFVITWNLIVSNIFVPLCLALLWYGIKRQFERKDEKDKQIDELKEAAIAEWRTRFSKCQFDIKGDVANINTKLDSKVDKDICQVREENINHKLERIEDQIRLQGG
jgi:hypothetical protein